MHAYKYSYTCIHTHSYGIQTKRQKGRNSAWKNSFPTSPMSKNKTRNEYVSDFSEKYKNKLTKIRKVNSLLLYKIKMKSVWEIVSD